MVAGHTKFAPDRLFAQVVNSYNQEDMFTIAELQRICNLHANTTIDDSSCVLQWHEATSLKYSDLPGTRKYHNFLIACSVTSNIVMKVREKCYAGTFSVSPLQVIDESAVGIPTDNYKVTHTQALTQEKWATWSQCMTDTFLQRDNPVIYLLLPLLCQAHRVYQVLLLPQHTAHVNKASVKLLIAMAQDTKTSRLE